MDNAVSSDALMDNELLMRVGTAANGNNVTKIIDAAEASRCTYVNTTAPTNIPVVEMSVAKCCPISYTGCNP